MMAVEPVTLLARHLHFFIVGNIAIIERSFLNIILIMKYLHVIQKTGLRKSLSAVRVKRHFRFILMKLGENID